MMFYDRAGRPIDVERFNELLRTARTADDYRRVAADTVDGRWVSTVWLGVDHQFGDARRPLIFETMVFASEEFLEDLYCRRYSTEYDARTGHDEIVAALRAGVDPGDLS